MNDKVGKYLKYGNPAEYFAGHVRVYTETDVREMLLALRKDMVTEIKRLRLERDEYRYQRNQLKEGE